MLGHGEMPVVRIVAVIECGENAGGANERDHK
jgi:hypothetical protein